MAFMEPRSSLPPLHKLTIGPDVHRCGTSGSMRACHAAGPGSIPGRNKFPRWGFFGVFFSPVRHMSGSFRPRRSPNIVWPSLSSSIIFHYRPQWPEMLMRPKTSNIHTLVLILSKIHPVPSIIIHLLQIQFNIILPSTFRPPQSFF